MLIQAYCIVTWPFQPIRFT